MLPLGDNQAMFAHLHAAEALASARGDDRRLGWILAYLTTALYRDMDMRFWLERAQAEMTELA